MTKKFVYVLAVGFFLAGCTSAEKAATEAVANDQSIPSIPHSPGDSGESTEKPAGAGEAGSNTFPESENVEAANRSVLTPVPGTVSSGALNVRAGPGMKYEVVKVLQKGEAVTATDCGIVWCKIGEGQFVAKKFINQ